MAERLDTASQIEGMLARGWAWSDRDPSRLVHPADHNLYVRVDRAAGTMALSPALARLLELVIPTPASKGAFWRRTPER